MVRVVRSCSEDCCPYDGIYTSPRPLCEWHWHLWFAFDNAHLALEDMRRNRSLRIDGDLGYQRPVTYLDRMGNDAARRFAADLANDTADAVLVVRSENPLEVVDIEVRTYETDLPFLRLVASNG
jgi:hypothetical protein